LHKEINLYEIYDIHIVKCMNNLTVCMTGINTAFEESRKENIQTCLISPPIYSILSLMSGAPLSSVSCALCSSSSKSCNTLAELTIWLNYVYDDLQRLSEPHYQSWSGLALSITRSQGKLSLILRAQYCSSCFPVSYMIVSVEHWYCSYC